MSDLIYKNTTYRSDIDGLRAVAVLSILLYHAELTIFSGGYVGVDIFFVVSGFLITRLILKEIELKGRLDFGRFYLRRARRLLPVFFFTLICSSFLAFLMLPPKLLENYGASLITAVLSISNIYFYSESGYFDTSATLKPLLHMWSLGVEEQFYLFWPVLLCLFARRKWVAPLAILAIGLTSLYFSQKMLIKNPEAVFFLMPFRVFEFSIGSSMVWLIRAQPKNKFLLETFFICGLLLIIWSIFSYDEKTSFPGITALLPCIGAALCIYAGQAQFSSKLIDNKPFVAIGLISYSLYLIHWPVIVFYKYYADGYEFTNLESLLLILGSFLISAITYLAIEKPFRRPASINTRFLCVMFFCALSVSYLAASMWAQEGWGWRAWATSGKISAASLKDGKELRFKVRNSICRRKGWAICDNLISGKVNALILGDSHAIDALNAFENIYPNHNFVMSTLGGCPPYRDIEIITPFNHPDREKCKNLNILRFDKNYLKSFDYIVINTAFGWYTTEHLREYLNFLKESHIKKVIVVGYYLTLKRDMSELINEYGYNPTAIKPWVIDTSQIEPLLESNVSDVDYFFLSKRKVFCKNDNCDFFDGNNIPFTYDQHHLSYAFAIRLAVNKNNELDQYLGFSANPKVGF